MWECCGYVDSSRKTFLYLYLWLCAKLIRVSSWKRPLWKTSYSMFFSKPTYLWIATDSFFRYYANELMRTILEVIRWRGVAIGSHTCKIMRAECGMLVKLATGSCDEQKSSNCPHQSKIKKLTWGHAQLSVCSACVLINWFWLSGAVHCTAWPLNLYHAPSIGGPNSPIQSVNEVEDLGGMAGTVLAGRECVKCWLCGGGVGPPTWVVWWMSSTSLCAFWCCAVLLALFVDFWWSVKISRTEQDGAVVGMFWPSQVSILNAGSSCHTPTWPNESGLLSFTSWMSFMWFARSFVLHTSR